MTDFLHILSETALSWIASLKHIVPFLKELMVEYGYWVVVAGALIEGEVILIAAGASAYYGHMKLPYVILISFVGAVIHDQTLFYVGRSYGRKLINRRPAWQQASQKVFKMLDKYGNYFICSFRFIYGIRTITPIAVGASNISARHFTILTLFSAFAWAAIVASAGYIFAETLEMITEKFAEYQKYFALGFLILIGGIWIWRKARKAKDPSPL